MTEPIPIASRNYWFKVVEMLQQNWALIEAKEGEVIVYFISDTSGVFDELNFPTAEEVTLPLFHNVFNRFAEYKQVSKFIRPPDPPFHRSPHPHSPIYSSGRFWKEVN